MTCAVVDPSGNVVNIIVADANQDPAPAGFTLINIPDGMPVDTRWQCLDGVNFTPTLAFQAELDAAALTPPHQPQT